MIAQHAWTDRLIARNRIRYTFNVDGGFGGGNISLWTALEVTGIWERVYAYTMPAPFTPEGGDWLCYAAKSHPELAANPVQVRIPIVLSKTCNDTVLLNDTVSNSSL